MKKILNSKLLFLFIGIILGSTSIVLAYSLFANNIGYTPKDSSWEVDNVKTALDDLNKKCEYCKVGVMGLTWNFEYLSREEQFKVPVKGTYKLETWGAQGGDATSTYIGGYGAYSVGTINLEQNTILYINVGTKGNGGCISTDCSGGYNGGGTGIHWVGDSRNVVAGGGGATSISFSTGLINDVTMRESALIVSGGGAGGYYHNYGNDYSTIGGAGGGINGESGPSVGFDVSYATGGTQTSGGLAGYRGANGSLGQGGTGQAGSSGGGGGWYGGGSAAHAGGGGGSGYIGSSILRNKKMVMYTTNTKYKSDDENTKTEITTNFSDSPTSNYAKKGSGYARITLISLN